MFKLIKQNLGKIIVGSVLVFSSLFGATHVFAQQVDTTKPTAGDSGGFVLCGNTADNPCTIGHLFAAFIVIINYLIAMAGFVAVAAIVFAGFNMVYSQGQEGLKAAKSRFAGAIIGLVLVAFAFILINSLFSGRFSVGVCGDKLILAHPLDYIKNEQTCK